jgi:hypothetical protein
MSRKAAKHHRRASEHHTHAALHHEEAAKHHEAGHHEKAAHHAHTASAHVIHAKGHAEEAAKAHADEFRKEVKEFWSKIDQRKGVAILIIFLLGGFSGRFGGYGYGFGHGGIGIIGVILIISRAGSPGADLI